MLMSEGRPWSSSVKASSPPAEAPIPAMGNDSSSVGLSTRILTRFRIVDSIERERFFPSRARARLFLAGLRSSSFCANRQTLEDISHCKLGLVEYKRATPRPIQRRLKVD